MTTDEKRLAKAEKPFLILGLVNVEANWPPLIEVDVEKIGLLKWLGRSRSLHEHWSGAFSG